MQISIYCENIAKQTPPVSDIDTETIAESFLKFVLDGAFTKDFSCNNDYSFEILLCDNDFIHNINKEYRNIDNPTDVITFALFVDSEEKIIVDNVINLGQILISLEKVYFQAQENNITPKEEFLNLLAHGILHLLGFDHQTEESLESMLELQNRMIEGVNNVKI